MSYVTYHEPNLTQVLVLSSFLYLANVARWIADKLLFAGLLGEIAMGIIFGTPLSGILDPVWEQTFLSLGYLGLLLIVFEGGLSTPLKTLLRSLPIATLVALTGIFVPIGLSFLLMPIASFGPLEAFAAGSSLSSTSLGTTFVVLKAVGGSSSSKGVGAGEGAGEEQSGEGETVGKRRVAEAGGLEKTRLGTILAGAAVFDDVIGFVLSSVISTLGSTFNSSDIPPWSIARPLVTSLLFSALTPLIITYVLSPLFHRVFPPHRLRHHTHGQHLSLFLVVGIFSGCLAIAYVIGSSMLLGAYVAGLIVTSLDGEDGSMRRAFEEKVVPVQTYILSPVFFASIGTAIPFLSLWTGKIIWQGLVYSLLMVFAKVICGIWILLWGWGEDVQARRTEERLQVLIAERGLEMQDGNIEPPPPDNNNNSTSKVNTPTTTTTRINAKASESRSPSPINNEGSTSSSTPSPPPQEQQPNSTASSHQPFPPTLPPSPNHSHIPPALFLGFALVARGEIGLLISQLAHSEAGLLGQDAFLVTTWAIVLCTVVGPISVGLLVKRLGVDGVVRGRWV